MATDTPTLYLNRAVRLLTGTRGLGGPERVREGYTPYSYELDFSTVDENTARNRIAWALDQAPYAQIELVPASAASGLLTVFVRVELRTLAMYLAERSLMQETGQTWQTASGPLPDLARQAIERTVGAGEDWQALLDEMAGQISTLRAIRRAAKTGEYLTRE